MILDNNMNDYVMSILKLVFNIQQRNKINFLYLIGFYYYPYGDVIC